MMLRQARGEVLDPDQVQIAHCINRVVRRAFLCGDDPLTGQSFEHRRGWIHDRFGRGVLSCKFYLMNPACWLARRMWT